MGIVLGNLALPSTGSYDSYASVNVAMDLAKGRNVVTFAFDGGQGSAGYLNLDRVTFHAK